MASATAIRLRKFRRENRAIDLAYKYKWKAANREKYLAHKAVEYALVSGAMKREPCFCGAKAQAHHDDYTKRRDVIWLCPTHHKERHRRLKEKPL